MWTMAEQMSSERVNMIMNAVRCHSVMKSGLKRVGRAQQRIESDSIYVLYAVIGAQNSSQCHVANGVVVVHK